MADPDKQNPDTKQDPDDQDDTAFEAGVVAGRTGVGRDANPFEPKSAGYSDWNAGYDSFKDADEVVEPKNT